MPRNTGTSSRTADASTQTSIPGPPLGPRTRSSTRAASQPNSTIPQTQSNSPTVPPSTAPAAHSHRPPSDLAQWVLDLEAQRVACVDRLSRLPVASHTNATASAQFPETSLDHANELVPAMSGLGLNGDTPPPTPVNSADKPNHSTPSAPSQASGTYSADRDSDDARFRKQVESRVIDAKGIGELLCRMGGESLVSKWRNETKTAKKMAISSADEIKDFLKAERLTNSPPATLMIDDAYWIEALAGPPQDSVSQFAYARGSGHDMQPGHFVTLKRRPDASLILRKENATQFEWGSLVLPIELTVSPAVPNGNILNAKKYVQLLTLIKSLLLEQPWRLYVVGLSFQSDTLVMAILDHEVLHHSITHKAFGLPNIRQTLALLRVLRSANLFELGFSPFYRFDVGFPNATTFPTIRPHQVVLENGKGITIQGDAPINLMQNDVFSRSTVVWKLDEPSCQLDRTQYAKFQWVADDRHGRETVYLERLAKSRPVPEWAPRLKSSMVKRRLACQIRLTEIQHWSGNAQQMDESQARICTARHLEGIVTETQKDARPVQVKGVEPRKIVDVIKKLIEAIDEARRLGLVHRDISSGNVLVTPDGQLVWIDWECAADLGGNSKPSLQRMGTLDTMCIAGLTGMPYHHTAVHDVESAVYLCWKLTMLWFDANVGSTSVEWTKLLRGARWNIYSDPSELAEKRHRLWIDIDDYPGPQLVELFPGYLLSEICKEIATIGSLIWNNKHSYSPDNRYEKGYDKVLGALNAADAVLTPEQTKSCATLSDA